MRLVAYLAGEDPRAGVVREGGGVVDVADVTGGRLPSDPAALLAVDGWAADIGRLDLDTAPATANGQVVLAAPQPRPGKIVAVGLNYRDHASESQFALPDRPLLFAKWPNSIAGPNAVVVLPKLETDQLDYEAELGVIIGSHCRNVAVGEALGYVGGYTIANDISARDIQVRDGQWTLAKSFDGFCPLGPAIVTADEVPDPQDLSIRTWVNEELRQSSRTDDMVFGVADLIAYVSQRVTLLPGDLLLTGTPAGVGLGFDPPRWLAPGDVVTCEIEGLGSLRTEIGAPT